MKKLLNKIIPNPILKLLIKQKYKKIIEQVHLENILTDRIVNIECNNINRYDFLKKTLYKSFSGIIKIDKYSFYYFPIAIIKIPQNIDDYLKLIGAKSRNMNKKAQKGGIVCEVFDWNEKLDEIYEINTSSMSRQGRKMDQSYQEYPKKVIYPKEDDFSIIHIGAFKNDKLIGYIELYNYSNFSMTNRILGHKEYLKYGVMNIMVKKCVEYAINSKKIEFINYLTMQNKKNNSLSAFKYRVGFREYSLMGLK